MCCPPLAGDGKDVAQHLSKARRGNAARNEQRAAWKQPIAWQDAQVEHQTLLPKKRLAPARVWPCAPRLHIGNRCAWAISRLAVPRIRKGGTESETRNGHKQEHTHTHELAPRAGANNRALRLCWQVVRALRDARSIRLTKTHGVTKNTNCLWRRCRAGCARNAASTSPTSLSAQSFSRHPGFWQAFWLACNAMPCSDCVVGQGGRTSARLLVVVVRHRQLACDISVFARGRLGCLIP